MSRAANVLVLLTLAVTGCGIDKADIGVKTPPLLLRDEGTFPADSTQNLYDARGLDLIAVFNRVVEPGEVSLVQIVPGPGTRGEVFNPNENPKEVMIRGVVFDQNRLVYRLVLDGPAMPAPRILSYYSGEATARNPAIQGHMYISRGGTSATGALVYALVPPGVEDDYVLSGNEDRFLGRPVIGVTTTLEVSTEDGGWFRLAGLPEWRDVVVLAILDTNQDGRYLPDEDWWGYYRNEFDNPVPVMGGVTFGGLFTPPLPELRSDIDFEILPPGSLDPGFPPVEP